MEAVEVVGGVDRGQGRFEIFEPKSAEELEWCVGFRMVLNVLGYNGKALALS